jgi:hypothetical protein
VVKRASRKAKKEFFMEIIFSTPEAVLQITKCEPTGRPGDEYTVGSELWVEGQVIKGEPFSVSGHLAQILRGMPEGQTVRKRSLGEALRRKPAEETFRFSVMPGSTDLRKLKEQEEVRGGDESELGARETRRARGIVNARVELAVNALRTDLSNDERQARRGEILQRAAEAGINEPERIIHQCFAADGTGNLLGIRSILPSKI